MGPSEVSTPDIASTKAAQYQNAHPGQVIRPISTIDVSPNIARDDKQTLVVQRANCSYAYVLIAASQVAQYKASLPPGNSIVSFFPANAERPRPDKLTANDLATRFPNGGSPVTTVVTTIPPPPATPKPDVQTAVVRGTGQ